MGNLLSRRDWHRLAAAGAVGCSQSGWLERLAAAARGDPKRRSACILLWMSGGPSQMDTFDLKPGTANGGSFKEIATAVPGIRISEHLPQVARRMKDMAIIRSMTSKEADHGRATYLLRTGRVPGGPIQYPALGALLAKELEHEQGDLPGFVSIAPFRVLSPAAFASGFLGPQYAPLIVGELNFGTPDNSNADAISRALQVDDLARPGSITRRRADARLQILDDMEAELLAQRTGPATLSHRTAYRRAVTMMRSPSARAFELDEEPRMVRDRYGRTLFGQGCLLARRLVERGVPFVEVTLGSAPGLQSGVAWDTHQNNFDAVRKLSLVLDQAWSALVDDLTSRGMLDSTLIVWMGEFGRTPKIQGNVTGRDHWATSWASVLCGGGIKGGQVIGRTSADGSEIADRPVAVQELLGTVGQSLGLDIAKQNMSNVGRPIRFVDPGVKPIAEILP